MGPIRLEERMQGTVHLQNSLVYVGYAHDNLRAEEAVGGMKGGEGSARVEYRGAHHRHAGGGGETATTTTCGRSG